MVSSASRRKYKKRMKGGSRPDTRISEPPSSTHSLFHITPGSTANCRATRPHTELKEPIWTASLTSPRPRDHKKEPQHQPTSHPSNGHPPQRKRQTWRN